MKIEHYLVSFKSLVTVQNKLYCTALETHLVDKHNFRARKSNKDFSKRHQIFCIYKMLLFNFTMFFKKYEASINIDALIPFI